MNIAEEYIQGLKSAYLRNNGKEDWSHFEKNKQGARKEDLEKLKRLYPNIPSSLLQLLEFVDGTYWREYGQETVAFFFLGSDIKEYPYYLLSSEQIIENKEIAKEYYSDFIAREYDEVEVDEKITDNVDSIKWLHFSDCMNNGGTSQLFIDFSPSDKGKVGQIVRFVHDPDEFKVIADSFDEYLKKIIDYEYDFVNEDIMEL